MYTGAIAVVAFWTFVTVICVGGLLMPYLRQREIQKTIRALAQSGQNIDPATIEHLISRMGDRDGNNLMPYEYGRRLVLPGAILIALGPGLAMLGFFVGLESGRPIFPLFGVGGLLFLMGVGIGGYGFWLMRTNPPKDQVSGR